MGYQKCFDIRVKKIALVDSPAIRRGFIVVKREATEKFTPEVTENYIRVRIENPDKFVKDSFRVMTLSESKGIKAVIAKYRSDPDGSTHIQSYLFVKDKWTVSEAESWVEDQRKKGTLGKEGGEKEMGEKTAEELKKEAEEKAKKEAEEKAKKEAEEKAKKEAEEKAKKEAEEKAKKEAEEKVKKEAEEKAKKEAEEKAKKEADEKAAKEKKEAEEKAKKEADEKAAKEKVASEEITSLRQKVTDLEKKVTEGESLKKEFEELKEVISKISVMKGQGPKIVVRKEGEKDIMETDEYKKATAPVQLRMVLADLAERLR